MTREEKYDAVNQCETAQELAEVILSFADVDGMISGRRRVFDAKRMADNAIGYITGKNMFIEQNALTREFGIRQQAMYIKLTFFPNS